MGRDQAYQAALERIEAARHEGATELDLSNMGLTEVPGAIASLTQLQELDLSRNHLTALPEAIASLTQLETLNLSDNHLTELPEAIASLTQLQELDLSNNQLTQLPDAIGSLSKLRSLNLSDNELTQLPEAIASLTQLQELDLFDNELTQLPDAIGFLTQLQTLDLGGNQLTELPEVITSLTQLQSLDLGKNHLKTLPNSLINLTKLTALYLWRNPLSPVPSIVFRLKNLVSLQLNSIGLHELSPEIALLENLEFLHLFNNELRRMPPEIGQLKKLKVLEIGVAVVGGNLLDSLPEEIGLLSELESLRLDRNQLTTLPNSLSYLHKLKRLDLANNPLNPDIAAAYKQSIEAVMQYLRAKAEGEVMLNEAKLILVGEGEVGKSCLLGALRADEWVDGRPTTHGIEIKPVTVNDPDSGIEITLNGWDFGGQRVYRPTHQLFFSSSAVYLVVWKPREGSQQGFVKEWITLIQRREPDAKILVVATHGGPEQRQADIDRQELIDLFGSDTILGFFHVNSKPNGENQCCTGIAELKEAIAKVSATLPGMGRTVPTKWQHVREILEASGKTHLPYKAVIDLCEEQGLEGFAAELFVRVSHTLGYLIHYHYDSILRDIVILKPDWLAKAISFVLDDKTTRCRNGLVEFDHLSQIWSHPPFIGETGYPKALHPVFLRLMERFDLSYKVVLDPASREESTTSLIAQLVSDNRPEQLPNWTEQPEAGDSQQEQICRIVDDRGQSANAEGLFYRLIVRLHKYSLGRANYENSVHWQRGLMLDNDYNGRALLEHTGTNIKITVRAAYPEFFLYELTKEVKWLVEHFWKGLQCEIMVPCIAPCGKNQPGLGLFDVQKLIESKRQGMPKFPCFTSGCNQWLDIDELIRNAPTSRLAPVEKMLAEELGDVKDRLDSIRKDIRVLDKREDQRFQQLDQNDRRILSQADERFAVLMQMLTDEAKDGPRLFSFNPSSQDFLILPNGLKKSFNSPSGANILENPSPFSILQVVNKGFMN